MPSPVPGWITNSANNNLRAGAENLKRNTAGGGGKKGGGCVLIVLAGLGIATLVGSSPFWLHHLA